MATMVDWNIFWVEGAHTSAAALDSFSDLAEAEC